MRGKQIFRDLISNDTEEQGHRQGRSENLIALRNKCLLARYYFYGHHKKKSYQEILQLLVIEFYITSERISRIIQKHTNQVVEMRERKLSMYRMQMLWPHYKW